MTLYSSVYYTIVYTYIVYTTEYNEHSTSKTLLYQKPQ